MTAYIPRTPILDNAPLREFEGEDLRGWVRADLEVDDPFSEIVACIDLSRSLETLHHGRNIIWRSRITTGKGPISVVVKQFRHDTPRGRFRRRFEGSKAFKSWRAANFFASAGLTTPRAVALVESLELEGPAWYITEPVESFLEARYYIRALNLGEETERFPQLAAATFFQLAAETARRMHDAGIWHRDYSAGNLLIQGISENVPRAFLVDLNRARQRPYLTLWARMGDLCRLPLERKAHQQELLKTYFGSESIPYRAWAVYRLQYERFHGGHRLKRQIRSRTKGLKDLFVSRSTYPHIPDAEENASYRDRSVWDDLSDQPHQHASKWQKMRARLGDWPTHGRSLKLLATESPGVWKVFQDLKKKRYREEVSLEGIGLALRPWPEDPEALDQAVNDLGVKHVLLRLHPWAENHDAEENLARRMHEAGREVVFSLPQNRDLVKDQKLWRSRITELAERFTPWGKTFQVGQAINRSKWGVWNLGEYGRLAADACRILRAHPGVKVIGPGVIDFEPHQTLAALNWREEALYYDGMASLLYVDRRGAPENVQAGFDSVDKATLFKAMALHSPLCGDQSWVTEVNWPLREGPYSPAGRAVSVDEESQADYLERYYLLLLASGAAERIYWWRLVARGYGLINPADGTLKRRPSFEALRTLIREVASSRRVEPLRVEGEVHVLPLVGGEGESILAVWTTGGEVQWRTPGDLLRVVHREGEEKGGGREVTVSSRVRYLKLVS